jgi:hypothetical protein
VVGIFREVAMPSDTATYIGLILAAIAGAVALFNSGGKLILPESLRPYMPDNVAVIEHDRAIFAKAVDPHLPVGEMDEDPRIQIYRTSMDAFLSWLALVASALDRKLFVVADIEDIGYWVAKIQSEVVVHPFIVAYGYEESIKRLIRLYRRKKSPYRDWVFPFNIGFLKDKYRRDQAAAPQAGRHEDGD